MIRAIRILFHSMVHPFLLFSVLKIAKEPCVSKALGIIRILGPRVFPIVQQYHTDEYSALR